MEEQLNQMYRKIEELTETIQTLQSKNDSLSDTVETLYSMLKVHETRLDVMNVLVKAHHEAINRQLQFNTTQMIQNKSFAAQSDTRMTDQTRRDRDILMEGIK